MTSALLFLAMTTLAQPAAPPRRVFVLHSGVHIYFSHPWKNHAAEVLRDALLERKVSGKDIVVLDCPFPTASIKDLVPRDGIAMFLDVMDPASPFAQNAYRRLHASLVKQGVGPDDEIVWIGHSAGGQVGMTMAHLSDALAKHPALAKDTRPYRFHSVVTLGTPVGSNHVPASVRVRHHVSPQDKIVRLVCDGGPWLLPGFGYRRTIRVCSMPAPPNCKVRCWYDVEHPEWIWERRVLDRVLEDLGSSAPSPWREPLAVAGPGAMLAQLVCRALESEHGVIVEELP